MNKLHYVDGTNKERQSLLRSGMKEISINDLERELLCLGYKINKEDSFVYLNSANENTYLAKSVAIVDRSGKSFANVDSVNRKHLKELQKLRRERYVFHAGRIHEL